MATLKDVAKLANVDVSTVSRALNNTSYVHPETKARVLKAVEELAYSPNVIAKSLRNGKRQLIAIIVPRLEFTVFAGIISGIEDEVRKYGYSTMIGITHDNAELEKEILSKFRNGMVDGIIIAPTTENNHLLKDIVASGIPIVQVIRNQEKSISSVVANYFREGYEAVKYLYSKGARKIGLINGPLLLAPYSARLEGYQMAIQELKLTALTADAEGVENNSFEYGYKATETLLEKDPDLDSVMAAVDIHGLGALRALKDQKRKVPEEVKVMSLTGHKVGSVLERGLTSLEIPSEDIGRSAADMIIEDIKTKQEDRDCRRIVFNSTLAERETT